MVGKIKRYFSGKGFGFIETEDGDYFFHKSRVTGVPVDEGDAVDFEVAPGREGKRPEAIAVVKREN